MPIFLLVGILALPALAQSNIPTDSLGKLTLTYEAVSAKKHVAKQVSTGRIEPMPGAELRLVAPMDPQQVRYLVADGEQVTQGQSVAMLKGSEVHHFRENLAAKKALLTIAKKRFDLNKSLFESGSISQSAWLDTSQNYYDAKLAFGHLDHFAEMFSPSADDDDVGFLIAPESGLFRYSQGEGSMEGASLGAIVSPDALRITTLISRSLVSQVIALETPHCVIDVERTEQVVNDYLVRVWSAPLTPQCRLQAGQRIQVTAHIRADALRIPADSVFYLHGQSSVFVLNNDTLVTQPVEVIGQDGAAYLLVSDQAALVNQQVLSSSVSAAQGILLGLGGVE